MMDFVIIILGFFLVYKATQISLLLGILGFFAFLAFMLYRRFTSICMSVALRKYTKGKKADALSWFERGYKHGMTGQQKVSYAYYLLREGRVERAEQIYGGLLGFGGIKPQERYYIKANQAILFLKTGRLAEAIEALEEIFPYYKTTNVYGSLSYAYILEGDLDKAEKFCLEAYDYNKDNTVILDNMVQVYTKKNDFEEAEKYSAEMIEKEPTFIEAYYDAAVVDHARGNDERARERLNHALTIEPTFLSNVSHEKVRELLAEL